MFITDSIDDALSVASLSVEAINSNNINKLSVKAESKNAENNKQQATEVVDLSLHYWGNSTNTNIGIEERIRLIESTTREKRGTCDRLNKRTTGTAGR